MHATPPFPATLLLQRAAAACNPALIPVPLSCAGLDLPGGATESSKVAQLKAACKEWGLAVGGSKPEIWQRVLDQVGGWGGWGGGWGGAAATDFDRRAVPAFVA